MSVAKTIRERYGVKLDPSYLSRMERGKAEIPLRTLFALARYYDADPRDLVYLEDFSDPDPAQYLFLQPDVKAVLQSLHERLGKDHLIELLWMYFRFVNRTLDLGDDSAPAGQ